MFLAEIPIPGTEPLGGTPEGWRLIIGIIVYIAAISFLMFYLWWKLPRDEMPNFSSEKNADIRKNDEDDEDED